MKAGTVLYQHPNFKAITLRERPQFYPPAAGPNEGYFVMEKPGLKIGTYTGKTAKHLNDLYREVKRDFYPKPLWVKEGTFIQQNELTGQLMVQNIIRQDNMLINVVGKVVHTANSLPNGMKSHPVLKQIDTTLEAVRNRYNERQHKLQQPGILASLKRGFQAGWEWVKVTLGIDGPKSIGVIPVLAVATAKWVMPVALITVGAVAATLAAAFWSNDHTKSEQDLYNAVEADLKLNQLLNQLPKNEQQAVKQRFKHHLQQAYQTGQQTAKGSFFNNLNTLIWSTAGLMFVWFAGNVALNKSKRLNP